LGFGGKVEKIELKKLNNFSGVEKVENRKTRVSNLGRVTRDGSRGIQGENLVGEKKVDGGYKLTKTLKHLFKDKSVDDGVEKNMSMFLVIF